jgi:hypothetical protein
MEVREMRTFVKLNHLVRVVSLLVLASAALTAQVARTETVVPLKNWAAPLYWHPTPAERKAAANPVPQLQFSATQVSADALTFVAVTPCRLVDTRGASAGFIGDTPFNGPSIPGGGIATFPVQSGTEAETTAPAACGTIPPIAEAYSLNLTVVPHSGGVVGYVTLWPAGATRPFVATLNDGQGLIVNNAAIVPAGTSDSSGGVSVYNDGPATIDVIIDMNGFFTAPTDQNYNTAIGIGTLASNTTGADNTATGYDALTSNAGGAANTAIGVSSMYYNTGGTENTAIGSASLALNTTGSNDTAVGNQALFNNTTGNDNTAIGQGALYHNTTGSNNIAIGFEAALNVLGSTNAQNNIHIGSQGNSGDTNVIWIGAPSTQTVTKIEGIYNQSIETPNYTVCIDATARLGTGNCSGTLSSRRYKDQIADMGDASSKLLQLRPVTFLYKPQYDDGSHTLQYGLVAEEVAKLYPEMVSYDKDGQPSSLKYQSLTPMLLNEVQKQAVQNRLQTEQIQQLADAIQLQQDENRKLKEQTQRQTEANQFQQEQNRKLEGRLAALEALLSSQTATAAQPASSQ